jgi:hypothetical protein
MYLIAQLQNFSSQSTHHHNHFVTAPTVKSGRGLQRGTTLNLFVPAVNDEQKVV